LEADLGGGFGHKAVQYVQGRVAAQDKNRIGQLVARREAIDGPVRQQETVGGIQLEGYRGPAQGNADQLSPHLGQGQPGRRPFRLMRRFLVMQEVEAPELRRSVFDKKHFNGAAEGAGQPQGHGGIGQVAAGFQIVNSLASQADQAGQFSLRQPLPLAVFPYRAFYARAVTGHKNPLSGQGFFLFAVALAYQVEPEYGNGNRKKYGPKICAVHFVPLPRNQLKAMLAEKAPAPKATAPSWP